MGELEGKVMGIHVPKILHWACLGSGRRRSSPLQHCPAASQGKGCGGGLFPRLFHSCRSTEHGLKESWDTPGTFLGHLHVPPAFWDSKSPLLTAPQPCRADGHPKAGRDPKCRPFTWAQVREPWKSFFGIFWIQQLC